MTERPRTGQFNLWRFSQGVVPVLQGIAFPTKRTLNAGQKRLSGSRLLQDQDHVIRYEAPAHETPGGRPHTGC